MSSDYALPATANAQSTVLTAGPLTLRFCTRSGMVRGICVGEIEVLRGIYAAVRDENWGTIPTSLSGIAVKQRPMDFRVLFTATCRQGPIDFCWIGTLSGEPDGTICYQFEGVARSTFRRNRIGLCVLHPIRGCAGKPCTIERSDGSREQAKFPDDISPNQPFRDIRSITHEPAPGLQVSVTLEGDLFEMEDQRNWSDASYKTYSTPLHLPFPMEVQQGTRIRQQVTVRLQQTTKTKTVKRPQSVRSVVTRLGRLVQVPKLGLCTASHGDRLSPAEVIRLRALRLDHLRVDLKLWRPDCAAVLAKIAEEATAMGVSLHLALHVDDAAEKEIARFLDEIETIRPPVAAWFLFHRAHKVTPLRWLDLCKPLLENRWPLVPVGAGTMANFAELNRERLPPSSAEIVCFSVNPQVHAFDDKSLVESLETQPQMVSSARSFARASIAVAPITLKPQFNPNATTAPAPALPGELPPEVDPRQSSLLAAGWTLGSVAQLSNAETEYATYFQTTGWLGVMETESGSPLPDVFPSRPGTVFPIYHVLADLADAACGRACCLETDSSLAVLGLFLESSSHRRLLVANLTKATKVIHLPTELFDGRAILRLRQLDQATLAEACTQPEEFRRTAGRPFASNCIELPPYGYARLETEPQRSVS